MSGWLWVLVVVYCDHMIKLIVVLTDNAPHCTYLSVYNNNWVVCGGEGVC